MDGSDVCNEIEDGRISPPEGDLLELLSMTDAAVQALNKSTRSHSSDGAQSNHSSKSISSHKSNDVERQRTKETNLMNYSVDSGINSKTVPTDVKNDSKDLTERSHTSDIITIESELKNQDSDVSTTASDVLIKSSTFEPNVASNLNLSNLSKSSKASDLKSSSFDSTGARRVKISSKNLREIKSPFETIEVNRNINEENIPPPLFKNSGTIDNTSSSQPVVIKGRSGEKQQSYFSKTTVPNIQELTKPGIENGIPKNYTVERHTPTKQSKTRSFINRPINATDNDNEKLKTDSLDGSFQQKYESVHLDMSRSSSQPEIVTVPEQIVTISARESSPSTISNCSDVQSEPMSDRQFSRFQLLSKSGGIGLKQGAKVDGFPSRDQKTSGDVEISEFKLNDKQKSVRQAFSKRYELQGPVKRVVQPKFIGHNKKVVNISDAESVESNSVGKQTSEAITAAVAASAAVAATQPFLKAHYELENRMKELMSKLTELQGGGTKPVSATSEDPRNQRIQELESLLALSTDKRIDYLEQLQSQQLQMQAKLLSISKSPRSGSPISVERLYSESSPKPRQAFSKTKLTDSRSKPKDDSILRHRQEIASVRNSPLDTPAPRSRPPKPYDTDASRHSISPPRHSKNSAGFLKEILANQGTPDQETSYSSSKMHANKYFSGTQPPGDPNYRSPQINRPAKGKYPTTKQRADSDVIIKATGLVDELESLKRDIRSVINGPVRIVLNPITLFNDRLLNPSEWKKGPGETILHPDEWQKKLGETIPVKDTGFEVDEKLFGPSPLDPYLERPVETVVYHASAPQIVPNPIKATVLPGFPEAKSVLENVQKSRNVLEENLTSVLRSRQEAEIYSIIETLYKDRSSVEQARIKNMVDERINSLNPEVQRDVQREIKRMEEKQKALETATKTTQQKSQPQKVGGRIRGRIPGEARIDTGLKRGSTEKENKENAALYNKFARTKVPQKPQDEKTLTQVYGKASYQKGRTTVKDPYLHFQNTPQPKSPRQVRKGIIQAKEIKSSKTQTSGAINTGGGPRQYYFRPDTGSYIPVTNQTNAPIPGNLIPMAVPLRKPRMDQGLTTSVSITSSGMVSSPTRIQPQVTAAENVAMVSVLPEEDEEEVPAKRIPELSKQILPSVDIDGESTPQTEKVRRVMSPDLSPVGAKYEQQYYPYDEPSEASARSEVSDDETEEGSEIILPGYEPKQPPRHHDPQFPPKLPSMERQTSLSDVLAEDIRRKDIVENRAVEWIEQELMARIISEMYPEGHVDPVPPKPAEISQVSANESDAPADESYTVMDAIGRNGLQLFIDAGQPVDNSLVNALVQEVLYEKMATMLGEKPDEKATEVQRRPDSPQKQKKPVSKPAAEFEPYIQEEQQQPGRIRTPQPTPKTSPTSSPQRMHSPQLTPRGSPTGMLIQPEIPVREIPPASGHPIQQPVPYQPAYPQRRPQYEPETESESVSESYDIMEELNQLAAQRLVIEPGSPIQHTRTVDTPPPSPKPEKEETPQIIFSPPSSPPLKPKVQDLPTEIQKPSEAPEIPRPTEMPKPVLQHSPPSWPEPLKLKEAVIPDDHLMKPPSPQPWGNPASPIPEENPNYKEKDMETQQRRKPMVMSVAAHEEYTTLEHPPSPPPKRISRSPSPIRRTKTRSPSPSESESFPTESFSDTNNDMVSEGQWLISRSEGEVQGFPVDYAMNQQRGHPKRNHVNNVSVASTLRDTDDLEYDDELTRSEGEFLYKSNIPPENEPMVAMLYRMQQQPLMFGQMDLPTGHVQNLLNATGKSMGEMSLGQMPPAAKRPVMRQRSDEEVRRSAESDHRSRENGSSPVKMTQFEDTKPHGSQSPSGSPVHQRQVTVSSGGRTSPPKSAMKKPPQPTKSQSQPEKTQSKVTTRVIKVRTSSEDYRDSLEDRQGATMSTMGSDTKTSDQMNYENLLQSGYLSQTFSQSDSELSRQPRRDQQFGMTQTLTESEDGYSGRHYEVRKSGMTTQSSFQSLGDISEEATDSRQLSPKRLKASGQSLGLSYSYESDPSGEAPSFSEAELQKLAAGSSTFKMSVTIPSTAGADDDEYSDMDGTHSYAY